MPDVYGRAATALQEHVGSLSQVIRVDSFVEHGGVAHGSRLLRVVNGGGLEFDIHPDRALDIGRITVDGVPVAWMSPTGVTGPDSAEPEGQGWLRTFGGGLLTTCGLDTFGPPDVDGGEPLGQHGRIGAQRAVVTRAEATAAGILVEGTVRQARVFGENLVLRRRISSDAGSDTLRIDDTVTNESFADQSHMILYHLNLGWPLLGERTSIDIPAESVTPRDADAESGMPAHRVFGAPVPGFREQVFTHALARDGETRVVVANPDNGLEAAIVVAAAQLPWIHQWKMTGQGHYALGIEPANSPSLAGRSAARAAGQVVVLAPGESAHYALAISLRQGAVAAARREEAA